jgi:hypothetical protein
MHRLLAYCAEMAVARRATDRQVKARKTGTRGGKQVVLDVALPSVEMKDHKRSSDEVLEDMAERVRKHQDVSCGCPCPHWRLHVENVDKDVE